MQRNRGPYPSRELGRKLKECPIENTHDNISNALELLKFKHKSLYAFIAARKEYFDLTFGEGEKEFFVTLKSNEGVVDYDNDDDKDDEKTTKTTTTPQPASSPIQSGIDRKQSYSVKELQRKTIKELRELLREAGVSYSGTKAVLIERSLGLQTAKQ